MKILVHDYSGHPFQVQLSRELARRGNDVIHMYSTSFLTPHGALEKRNGDPLGLEIKGIGLPNTIKKYSYLRRRQQEKFYGRLLKKSLTDYRPDVFISSNTPLDAQEIVYRECHRLGIPFIYWVQDYYSIAIKQYVRLPIIGSISHWYYDRLESNLIRNSDAIVFYSWGSERSTRYAGMQ